MKDCERFCFCKSKGTKKWFFELGVGIGVNVPIYVIIGFQQRDLLNSRLQRNDAFFTLPIKNAQINIGTEKKC